MEGRFLTLHQLYRRTSSIGTRITGGGIWIFADCLRHSRRRIMSKLCNNDRTSMQPAQTCGWSDLSLCGFEWGVLKRGKRSEYAKKCELLQANTCGLF